MLLSNKQLKQPINVQSGTSYTLMDSDHGKLVTLDNAAAITLNVNTGLRSDFKCEILQKGEGQVTFAGTATLLELFNRTKTEGAGAGVYVRHLGGNEFWLDGDLTPLPSPPSHGAGGSSGKEGRVTVGSLLDYSEELSIDSSSEIQYMQIYLTDPVSFSDLEVYLTKYASSNNIRLGIYDQTDPDDPDGEPDNRIARTDSYTLQSGDESNFVTRPLQAQLDIMVTGYYWFAFICSKTNTEFAATPNYPAGFLPRRIQSSSGANLPASAGGLSNPAGHFTYVGALVV